MDTLATPALPPHTVPVLHKAFRVFEAVARSSGDCTTKSLAHSLGIAQSTCYRILQSYVAAGWLRARESGTFELSFGLVPLLRPLLRHEVLIETVKEPMTQLAKTTGLTVKLTIRQGNDAVTIFSAQSPRPHAISSRVGATVSIAIGSSGAAFMGHLADTDVERVLNTAPQEAWNFQKRDAVLKRVREGRKQGHFVDGGSYQPNIHTISAPIFSHGREPIGVITLIGFPQDFAGAAKAALIRELKYTAGGCTQLIQGQPTISTQ
jgi:DNA-binding IclR family transcriptional regulator